MIRAIALLIVVGMVLYFLLEMKARLFPKAEREWKTVYPTDPTLLNEPKLPEDENPDKNKTN
ncbi:hypothetical protein [Candidatus Formimonas warabiya]|uniref:Uncharacterized protein n=1 Tax=Formimonas warabiya TaxID=1761012 RepID=A0A3G1KQ59_FORW1|nr:hypothetical protein [Candidatus Formimonas warabiya]ATW24570.1 hypothetical protein DCMF_07025 [Candidatus Formimonas warabiya]